MLKVIYYRKENCQLCDEAEALLELLKHDYTFHVEPRDIYTNDVWLEEYHLSIPVVKMNETELDASQINLETLEKALKKHT
ncbi:glutaredoxin family protein [Virgibacillus ainsalahensis]